MGEGERERGTEGMKEDGKSERERERGGGGGGSKKKGRGSIEEGGGRESIY